MDTSFGPAVCRICMCGETSIPYNGKQAGEPLISPCKCSGTMGLYHRSCLEHWLTVSNTKNCEICKFQFKLGVRKQSFFTYLRKTGFRKPSTSSDARNPLIDFAFTIIITPIAFFALMLCVRGARAAGKRYHEAYEKRYQHVMGGTRITDTLNESSMEFALFVFISVIIFFCLSTFLVIMLVNHYTQFKKWQAKNKIFFVIDQLDLERSLQYNPHWRSQYTITSRISNTIRWFRSSSPKNSVLESARSEGVQPESILGHNLPTTVIVMSQNSLQEDIAMSSLMSPQQFVNRCVSSTPQNFGLSPIALNDLYPSRFVEDQGIRKSQSVFSVCSFGNGVMVCSTPVNERIFTTSDTAFRMSTPDAIEEEPFEVKGRFQVERLDTPTKKM